MSAFLLAFLVALGGGTWVFTKLQSRTGYGNNKNAFTGAAVAALIMFIVVFTLAHMFLKSSN